MWRIFFAYFIIGCFSLLIFFFFKIQKEADNTKLLQQKEVVTILPTNWVTRIDSAAQFKGYYFHFFTEKCPYNGFAFNKLAELSNKYFQNIQFNLVVSTPAETRLAKKAITKYQLNHIIIRNDNNNVLRKSLEIKSNPRAVIINHDAEVYYHGNYTHSSVLCGFGLINYGMIALDQLIKGKDLVTTDYFVTQDTDCFNTINTRWNIN
ncbi:MAG: hypothetical protein AAGI07_14245 [Bacteroidota bacterium]